ncbi:MAG: metallophosphoesterase family protein [Desulfobacula sp.]|jgi:predicted phosphodiesterase|nr:metallophosphoesterase family protein [Desulfobacula sp.]MBT4967403.1 metallophosphoesterase family protein [Bacteroidota bacterium]MBT6337768.1 metallophosphoesterase family protein [Desulfobacula sp.]MBT7261386.1 metallophosphoesterase family protein [Desulfobacula sp.]
MEKLAVISDIHSNLEALTSVLNDISGQSIQKIVSLGDNIGYGPDPEDVLLKLKSCLVTSIRGNHEFAILNDSYKRLFNLNAITALDINRKKLSDSSIQYISSLDSSLALYGALFVHGISSNLIDGYIFNLSDAQLIKRAKKLHERIVFGGHTHLLRIYEVDNKGLKKKGFTQKISILDDKQYIINVGSVGQAKNGVHEATYVIWDIQKSTVEPRFVTYNYHHTAMKIKQAGLPQIYADIL